MAKLCKHQPHKVIDWILAPKYSNDTIRISVASVPETIEHYLIKFKDPSPAKQYGWFYMSGKMIRSQPKVPNGQGWVYEVPLSKREEFEPDYKCNH